MRGILLTFSGKHGDILWALPAARAMAETGAEIDFAVMPRYHAVLPLIGRQPYIRRAFAIDGWHQEHDGCGAWPRVPPTVPEGYDAVHHLTYIGPPQEPLAVTTMRQLSSTGAIEYREPSFPFIHSESTPEENLIAYAFNGQFTQEKERMLRWLRSMVPKARWENVATLSFDQAADKIHAARFFFGCRSANYVVACGLGKRVLTIEHDPGRRHHIFSCPGSREHMPDVNIHYQFADLARQWMEGPCD